MRKHCYNRVNDIKKGKKKMLEKKVLSAWRIARGGCFLWEGGMGQWFYDRYSDPLQLEVRSYKYRATEVKKQVRCPAY